MPTKSQNNVWIFKDKDSLVAVRKLRSVNKKLIVVFFKSCEIVKRITLDTEKIVTATWYTEQCLPKVTKSLKNLSPN